jgi:hypothetical protein
MDIKQNGSQASIEGPAEWFSGRVRIDPLFQAPAPARGLGVSVTFEPCSRTAWHSCPFRIPHPRVKWRRQRTPDVGAEGAGVPLLTGDGARELEVAWRAAAQTSPIRQAAVRSYRW